MASAPAARATAPRSVFAFEALFALGGAARLRAAGVEHAYDAQAAETLPPEITSKIVVEASGFVRASLHKGLGPDGRLRYDHHTGQVTFILSTPRDAAGVARHRAWLALMRETFLPARAPFATLPYQIMRFEETGGSITFVQDGERDRSELVFLAEIGLRPGV